MTELPRPRPTPGRRRLHLLAVLVGGTILLFGTTILVHGVVPGSDSCGRNNARVAVFAEFEVTDVASMRQRLPRFGGAPVLDTLPGPLRIVAFKGAHHGVPMLGRVGREPATPTDVVCVIAANGDEWYFSNVDFGGFTP